VNVSFNIQSIITPNIRPLKNENRQYITKPALSFDSVSFTSNFNYKKTKAIMTELSKSRKIAILSHKDPDADAISSGLLFLEFLKRKFKGKDIKFILNQEIPKYCKKIPFVENITKYKDLPNKNFDSVVVLDCDESRVDCFEIFDKAKTKINIDHHRNNEINSNFSKNLRIVSPDSVSTTQVIYDNFFVSLGNWPNPDMTECIMTGIVSDTGNLRHIFDRENFDKLMDSLAIYSKMPLSKMTKYINDKFDSSNIRSKELENLYDDAVNARTIIEKYTTPKGKKINYLVLDRKMIDEYKIIDNESDIKETINAIGSMNKIKCDISAILWEKESGEIRLSMRSRNTDLLKIAEHFNGGGHRLAAGATVKGSIEEAKENLLNVLNELG